LKRNFESIKQVKPQTMFDEEINWVEPYKFRNFKEVRNKGDFVKIVKDAQLPGKLNSKTIGKIETIRSSAFLLTRLF